MRRYEQIFILRPTVSEEEINQLIESTTSIITASGGSIIYLDHWGMKKLAYPIKKESQGYYVFCDCATTPAAISETERKFRIDEAVLKYLTVKIADDLDAAEIEEAKATAAEKFSRIAAADDDDDQQPEAEPEKPKKITASESTSETE